MGAAGRGRGRRVGTLVFALVCAVSAAVISGVASGKWTWWGLATGIGVGLLSALAGGRFDAYFDARKARAAAEEAEQARLEAQRAALVAGREPGLVDESRAGLLRPERGVVPFTGRRSEVAGLVGWCEDASACPLWLVTGPGGVGKTRLALELAEELRAGGWRCETTMVPGGEVEQVRAAHALGGRSLLVVDYAETRAGLGQMLVEVARLVAREAAGGVRVLLVARQAGEWWDLLGAGVPAVRALVEGAGRVELAAV
ncbi:MAG: repeat-containing protein, partial [Gemmatimonadales bacterium]|nr:repeat-containing protein [Gemmatimonadales bacterium]